MDDDPQKSSEAPPEWVRLLFDHRDRLESVQMVWRRANLPYRPVVPEDVEIRWLSDEEWDKQEREDTHFMWELRELEDDAELGLAIEALVAKLWSIARRWTDLRGVWCDFRLYGFNGDEELFHCGRRCQPSGERVTAATSRAAADTAELHSAHVRFLEDRIAIAQAERSAAFERSEKLLHNNHLQWSQLTDAMREATEFQREQVEAAKEMRSGMVELRAAAFHELQETVRVKHLSNVVKHGIDAVLGQLVPLADRAIEAFGGDRVVAAEVFPKFERAQQALRYLALTLTDTQVKALFDGDQQAGSEFRVVLDRASRKKDEIEALAQLTHLKNVFRSTQLRDVADPEQQMCLRYIIGRLAFFDIATDDQAQAQPPQA